MAVVIPVIGFECCICFGEDLKPSTEYKCTNTICEKQICDSCFKAHILTKRNCMFCRSPLIYIEEHREVPHFVRARLHWINNPLCKKIVCSSIAICTLWYILLLIYLITHGSNTYIYIYNNTIT